MKQLLPFALLAACTAPVVLDPLPQGLDDTCGAAEQAALIGQDVTALERVLLLGQVRVIRPGTVVTQDYRPERINFMIGQDDRITQITCG